MIHANNKDNGAITYRRIAEFTISQSKQHEPWRIEQTGPAISMNHYHHKTPTSLQHTFPIHQPMVHIPDEQQLQQ